MEFAKEVGVNLGVVDVFTTSGRGTSIEELADRAVSKIIHISETAAPPIRAQAVVFRDAIRHVIEGYMRDAVRADHVTVANKLREAGYGQLTALLD